MRPTLLALLLTALSLSACGGADSTARDAVTRACSEIEKAGTAPDQIATAAGEQEAALPTLDGDSPDRVDYDSFRAYLRDLSATADASDVEFQQIGASRVAERLGASCPVTIEREEVNRATRADAAQAAAERRSQHRAEARKKRAKKAAAQARRERAAQRREAAAQARAAKCTADPASCMTTAEVFAACGKNEITDYDTCFKAGIKHGSKLAEEAYDEMDRGE